MSEEHDDRIEENQSQNDTQLETYRQVASDVAHELNNLLFLISGYSEILMKNLDDHSMVTEVVQSIQAATSSVKESTMKLQAISQVENVEDPRDDSPNEETFAAHSSRQRDVTAVACVGDNELRQLVTRVLKRNGFTLIEIDKGNASTSPEPDFDNSADVLIIDDETTKSIGGEFVIELLRRFPQVPLLQLTDEANEVTAPPFERPHGVLARSFRPSELVDAVNQLLA